MKAVRTLLVGAITAVLMVLGVVTANASTAAPANAGVISPATILPPPGGGRSSLHCRSHAAESKPVKGKVVVPTSYCYDPTTSNHREWHDYCTKSPDSWGSADFRGPCARHDMCLQAGHSHGTCDGPLLNTMKTNCKHSYGWYNPSRYKCEGVAYSYYLVIKAYTWTRNHV